MAGEVVQALWVGSRLSSMEQLSICSFLRHGHPVHLYAFSPIENVPEGTIVRSAAEILPESEVFIYRRGPGKGSKAAFSDPFRYRLLLERGGWWTDLDMVCVRPLEFNDEHVYGCERTRDGAAAVNVALFRAPAGSPIVRRCDERVRQIDKSTAKWGHFGPVLTRNVLAELQQPVRMLPPDYFYPIDYWHVEQFLCDTPLPTDCHAIHLWNSQWLYYGLDPDARYAPDSLYEGLRREYLPAGWEGSLKPRGLGWHLAASGRRFLRSPRRWLQNLGTPSYQAAS
jgi:hypothetical protein